MVEETGKEEIVLIDLFDYGYHRSKHLIRDNALQHVWSITQKHYGTNIPFTYFMCYQDPICEEKNPHSAVPEMDLDRLKNGYKIVKDTNMAAILYTIKQEIDELDKSSVLIILPQQRKLHMDVYIEQLFTAVYKFTLECFNGHHDDENIIQLCVTEAEKSGLADEDFKQIARKYIISYLQSLPSLKGELIILKSQIIPGKYGLSTIPIICGVYTCGHIYAMGKIENTDERAHSSELMLVQVAHSQNVWIIGRPEPPVYDGIVTNQKAVTIAAPGADCIPILFCDPVKKACGAAHSGMFLKGVA
ncbi:hypothetical protein GDO78_000528 [Eleutherodactylus coqui]|uniref:Uncharacterized protein n=1 Tax=Eleutherodactylus coqui TaxID=57060 RepID=A0A8J6KLH1_ELECQ|nr:hypothetical protein GDO78_000528 [Eleutherodactylus coqui]